LRRPPQSIPQSHHGSERYHDGRHSPERHQAATQATQRGATQTCGQSHGRNREAGFREDASGHSADGEQRADRDVDLGRENDQSHADCNNQHRYVGQEHIEEVPAAEIAGRAHRQNKAECPDRRGNR